MIDEGVPDEIGEKVMRLVMMRAMIIVMRMLMSSRACGVDGFGLPGKDFTARPVVEILRICG